MDHSDLHVLDLGKVTLMDHSDLHVLDLSKVKIKKSHLILIIRASSRENLSSGFLTKGDSSQSSQLQRLDRKERVCL